MTQAPGKYCPLAGVAGQKFPPRPKVLTGIFKILEQLEGNHHPLSDIEQDNPRNSLILRF